MEITCIVVIYNLICENSITFKSLLEFGIDNLNVIICDNSTDSQIKKSNIFSCNEYGLKYIDMGGNKGLSKAYNLALKEVNLKTWYVILDQDTKITSKYFEKLCESICFYPEVHMHVPKVMSKNTLLSPAISKGYSVKRIKRINSGIYKDITAINSGMAVNREVLKETDIYNQKIFLDYLDHYFVRDFKKKFENIAVFDCIIFQDFSNEDHTNFNIDLNRFSIYSKDFYEYCKDSIKGRVFYSLKILYRSIKLSIIHRSTAFIKIGIERRKK